MNDMNTFNHDPESEVLRSADRRQGFDLPDGYAERLKTRLKQIPSDNMNTAPTAVRSLNNRKYWAFAAAAACWVAAVLILPQKKTPTQPCTSFDCMVEAWAAEETALEDLSASPVATATLEDAVEAYGVEPELFAAIDDTTMVLFLNDGYLSDLELYGLLYNEYE
jgi:hypothetical protein